MRQSVQGRTEDGIINAMALIDLRKIEVIAHRGAPREAPENTIAAFQRALEAGADWVELDIRKTLDKRAVVIHDATVNRTTDGRGRICEMSEGEITSLDAGSWFSDQFAGERVPTLDKALEWAKSTGIRLNVELKDKGIEELTIDSVRNHGMLEQVVISSFSINSLWKIRKIEHNARIAPIVIAFPKLGFLAFELAPEFIHLWVGYAMTRRIVDRANTYNILTNAWIVDNFRLLTRAARRGVNGIITNEVSLIRRTIEQTKPDNMF